MKSFFRSLGIAALVAIASLFSACTQIDTGNVGVVKTGGQFNAEELPAGLYFRPFSTVYEVSGKENGLSFNDMRPKTLDQITVEDLDVDIYYQLNAGKAQETMTRLAGDLAQNSDGDYVPGRSYMQRVAREAIYNAVATIKAEQAQAERGAIPGKIAAILQKELDAKFQPGWWTVTNVNLRNLTVDSKLEQKIRESAQVQYEIDAKVKQIKLEEAEAARLRAKAQGEADAARIKAEGLRAANGAEYLRLLEIQNQAEAIKKWNGQMPSTVAGGAPAFLPLK